VTEARIAIVGGGIAGLAAAYELARRQADFVLLEASQRFGGVIVSEESDGFLLEGGPDALLTAKPEAVALCGELGLGERLVPTNPDERAVFVLRGGSLHPLPEGVLGFPTRLLPFLRSGLFSWQGKLRMGLDLVLPRGESKDDESIAAFVRRRCGREAVERLADPLLAGIHAGDAERLSMACNFPRLLQLSRAKGSLIRGLLGSKPAAGGGAAPPPFLSLRRGLQELVEALTRALPPAALRRLSRVVSLRGESDAFVLELDGQPPERVRGVILALPAHSTAGLLAPTLPDAARPLASIPFADTATVLLGFRRCDVEHPLNGYGLVVPRGERLRTTACSFFSIKFPGRAPEGHVLLRGFLGGVLDPGILGLTDQALVSTVIEEMRPVLGIRGDPVLERIYRWPSGTPQMEVGHGRIVAEVEARLAECPRLQLTGAGLRGTGIPDAIADARRVASTAWEAVRA
jgi:oxygen-dependent protoporphyrinogen oxidase